MTTASAGTAARVDPAPLDLLVLSRSLRFHFRDCPTRTPFHENVIVVGLIQTITIASVTILTSVNLLHAAPADRILRGGPVVTVNPSQPVTEAVAITEGRIVVVETVWNTVAPELASEIDYGNFKDGPERCTHDDRYVDALHAVWKVMERLQHPTHSKEAANRMDNPAVMSHRSPWIKGGVGQDDSSRCSSHSS